MILEPGDIISIRHYSNPHTLRSIVVGVDNYLSSNDIISIRLTKEFAELNIFEGDPIAIALQRNCEIFTTSCHITEINPVKAIIKLMVENEEFIINKRAFERFPVSLYADVRERNKEDEFAAVVKNISLDGVMICVKRNFEKGQKFDIKLYLGKEVIDFIASVMWKMDKESRNDLGLKIIYMQYSHQKILRNYIEQILYEEEKLLKMDKCF